MLPLYHLNDVIAVNDTTVQRLKLQYQLIMHELKCDDQWRIEFIGAPFGDSVTTAAHLKGLIRKIQDTTAGTTHPQTICVNNASRAKHTDSGNAKGSPCLWGTITGSFPLHIVGVDTQVFAGIYDLFDELRIVHDITFGQHTRKDISQGSQFRSLEFFPLVQLLVQTSNTQQLRVEEVDIHTFLTQYPAPTISACDTYSPPVLTHVTTPGRTSIQDVQLVGQARKFRHDWGLPERDTILSTLSSHTDAFLTIKHSLQPNQLCILDRDHFNNTKCISAHDNGIFGLINILQIALGDEVRLTREHDHQLHATTGYIVATISDKTGYPCIRNGSSRGPTGEHLIELNYSIDASGTTRKEISELPLGTVLTLHPGKSK